jgi:hypothetical protein
VINARFRTVAIQINSIRSDRGPVVTSCAALSGIRNRETGQSGFLLQILNNYFKTAFATCDDGFPGPLDRNLPVIFDPIAQ